MSGTLAQVTGQHWPSVGQFSPNVGQQGPIHDSHKGETGYHDTNNILRHSRYTPIATGQFKDPQFRDAYLLHRLS